MATDSTNPWRPHYEWRALILWLAIEGLVLHQLLQVSAIDAPTRRRLFDKMLTIVSEAPAPIPATPLPPPA